MKYFLFIFLLLISCSEKRAHFESHEKLEPVSLKAYVDKAVVTSKETITFSIELTYAKNLELEIPEVGSKIENLRIIDAGSDKPQIFITHVQKKKWYKLKGDINGTYILPKVEISYDLNGEKKYLKTSEIFVEVKENVDVNAEKDIRDIKGIILSPSRLLIYLLIFFAIVVLSLIVLVFIKKFYKKKAEVPVPCHEIAINELENLRFPKNKEEIKPFFFSLSDIIRNYFEKRFELNVTDLTLYEIKNRIDKIDKLSISLKKDFLKILEDSDMVKFTDFEPQEENIRFLFELSKKFVLETKVEELKEAVA